MTRFRWQKLHEGVVLLLAYILLALVALAASGCGVQSTDSPNGVVNTSRKVAGYASTYNGSLIAFDDSLRGVTCYSQGSETLSCVHTGVGRGVVER